MKAIIPVAGAGVKLRPLTHTQPKPLIPVAGKPILAHIVEGLLAAGIQDFIFVVGYLGDKICAFIREQYAERMEFCFVEQDPRLGTAHALFLCREAAENAPLLVVLGDTIVDTDFATLLAEDGTVVGVQAVEDPRKFGVALLDESGYVARFIEKPSIPKSNLALVGLYKIKETALLFETIEEMIRDERKTHFEYQLTDALTALIERGVKIKVRSVEHWFDCGQKNVLLETNRILLARDRNEPPHAFENVVILPPVSIAPDCQIRNSIIGPFVAIGEGSIIQNSIVEDSILGPYSTLDSIILRRSIVGVDARLVGVTYSVNIGDDAQIDFRS